MQKPWKGVIGDVARLFIANPDAIETKERSKLPATPTILLASEEQAWTDNSSHGFSAIATFVSAVGKRPGTAASRRPPALQSILSAMDKQS